MYFVQELCGDTSLRDYIISDRRTLTDDEYRQIFRQMLMSVKALHDAGIYHKDIKPINFMYDSKTKTVKLIDFGTCTDENSLSDDSSGTETY